MRYLFKLFLLSSVFIISACATDYVATDYNPNQDFSKYKNYAWLKKEEKNNAKVSELDRNRIKAAIDHVLAQKVYSLTDEKSASFLISYFVTVEQKRSRSSNSYGYVGYGGYGPHGGVGVSMGFPLNNSENYYDEGTLIIDIIDATDNKLIWRGSVSREIYDKTTPQEREKMINQSVTNILAKFPPGAEKTKSVDK